MIPDRTLTYPVDLRGYQSGPDLITALGVVGTGITLPMLAAQTSFTLGRADRCDLQVSQKYLASMHARLDRVLVSSRANIRVSNVSSRKNDVVYNEVAEREFLMGAGEWFEIGEFAQSSSVQSGGILSSSDTQRQENRRVWVKVEELK